jgi:ribonuclease HI
VSLVRSTIPQQQLGATVGWFDGASQSNGQLSGVGGVIRYNEQISYKWTFNCGEGTNTKAELLGAWATLTLASRLDITYIKVLGDSRIVIHWLNNKGKLQVIALDCWKERIRDLIKNFEEISFTHIIRELNSEVDLLSKMALQQQEGKISYNKWVEGSMGPTLYLNLF